MRNNPILCPYCGAEMTINVKPIPTIGGTRYDACFKCYDGCESVSSIVSKTSREEAVEHAYAAAQRRYVPPIKPLSWEDAVEKDHLYIEYFHSGLDAECVCLGEVWNDGSMVDALRFGCDEDDGAAFPVDAYGKTWRCWARRPTDEERAAAAWEVE